ncbi:MAG: hypothetical protein PPHEINF_5762 [uncultured Paraburkholderia sp.]|nr:MAG: hypothetical protein PPHEINF_5762 [uncultured Paraburkholderia sp.]CAH2807088.1 MAG: hypothetical protein PPHEESC_5768 [uncultured Paraburkholderia sp.]CAH2942587.1 MAG: hypothetical protein PPHEMADMSA_5786 [uncultured Paraburkholderia sp.]CAH2943506.1 MAG: hypothetical protein PPHERAN_5796 [uncultured Paraburkholderia sp.]
MKIFDTALKYLVALGCGLVTVVAVAQDISVTPDVKSSGVFTIASSLDYAPFEFTDAAGKPSGLDIELATAVAATLAAKLNIVTIPFPSQIPSLATHRVTVAWSSFSVTEERLKQVDFVSFLQTSTVASVLPERAKEFRNSDDLCGKTVAVNRGSAEDFAADQLRARCTKATLKPIRKQILPSQQDCVQAVLTGRADAVFDDQTAASYYEMTSGRKLVVTPSSYYPTPLGVAVAKGDKATAAMLAGALKKLMADGTYARIVQKYNMRQSAIKEPTIYTDASQLK